MLYLSAQPDQPYFIWQLEIQLRNFHALEISRDQIQILGSYKPEKGVSPLFEKFMGENAHLANFYVYPDNREQSKYTSSIRPHILKQHFERYPALEKETLFYHDSDILFSHIPQIADVETNATCYVSDTRNYLDIDYIRRVGTAELLSGMTNIVGIPVNTIESNKSHTGGAQYILKGINAAFWKKVEHDSEDLYILMKNYNTKLWEKEYAEKKDFRSKKRGIQAWCADMWAVLWNLWLLDKKVEIHPEMDFSWPYSPIEEWDKKAIQHYSGNIKEKDKYFKKSEYLNYMPWYDKGLLSIPKSSCSYKIVEMIRTRKAELDQKRPSFPNCCIVYDGRNHTEAQLESYSIIRNYIHKHIEIDLYLLIDPSLPSRKHQGIQFEKLLSVLDGGYEKLIWIPLSSILDIQDLHTLLKKPLKEESEALYPEESYKVDTLFVETFSKVLDMELLHLNKGKFNSSPHEPIIHAINPSKVSISLNQQIENIRTGNAQQEITKSFRSTSYTLIS